MGSFWAVVISLAYGSLSSVEHLTRIGSLATFRYIPSQCAAHNGSIIWAWLTQAFVTFRHITAACYGHRQVKPAVTLRNISPGSTHVLQYACTLVRLFHSTPVPLAQLMGGISQAYGTPVLEYVCTVMRLKAYAGSMMPG